MYIDIEIHKPLFEVVSVKLFLPNDSKGVPLPCSLTCHVRYAADMAYQTGPGQDQACSAKQPA